MCFSGPFSTLKPLKYLLRSTNQMENLGACESFILLLLIFREAGQWKYIFAIFLSRTIQQTTWKVVIP